MTNSHRTTPEDIFAIIGIGRAIEPISKRNPAIATPANAIFTSGFAAAALAGDWDHAADLFCALPHLDPGFQAPFEKFLKHYEAILLEEQTGKPAQNPPTVS
jgi:hypothetical protein